ncbi:MAG: Smr/MutS family protein [Neisseriaceae bacterium]|nr:Smr/MutS family protein [Neisseriaceae bacterium]
MTTQDWQKQLKQAGKIAQEQAIIRQRQAEEAKRLQSEQALFSEQMAGVKPIKNSNRVERKSDKTPIIPRQQESERDTDNDVFIGTSTLIDDTPPTQYAHGGGGKNDIKKLLSAQDDDIIATLDLHGYNQEEAQTVLNEFIDFIQKKGTIGEIVHGSGLGSKGFKPTLKNLVRRWLIAHPQVLAYTEPPHNDGAVLVLLKRKKGV